MFRKKEPDAIGIKKIPNTKKKVVFGILARKRYLILSSHNTIYS